MSLGRACSGLYWIKINKLCMNNVAGKPKEDFSQSVGSSS